MDCSGFRISCEICCIISVRSSLLRLSRALMSLKSSARPAISSLEETRIGTWTPSRTLRVPACSALSGRVMVRVMMSATNSVPSSAPMVRSAARSSALTGVRLEVRHRAVDVLARASDHGRRAQPGACDCVDDRRLGDALRHRIRPTGNVMTDRRVACATRRSPSSPGVRAGAETAGRTESMSGLESEAASAKSMRYSVSPVTRNFRAFRSSSDRSVRAWRATSMDRTSVDSMRRTVSENSRSWIRMSPLTRTRTRMMTPNPSTIFP